MKRAVFALLLLVCAISAGARVISYAPYTDRVAIPAFQARTNRHFALVESANSATVGGGYPIPLPTLTNSQLVVYDSQGLEEPRVVFPPDGTTTQINVAAVREDDSQLALIVQSTYDGGLNPQHENDWFLSVDGGATWTKPALPENSYPPYSSTSPYWNGYDIGGPNVRSAFSAARAATHDTPFVVTPGTDPQTAGVYSVARNGSVKRLASGVSSQLIGENLAHDRFLVMVKPNEIGIVDLAGNYTAAGNSIDRPSDGWIATDGSAYVLGGYTTSNRYLRRFSGGNVSNLSTPSGSANYDFLAVPTADYSGAWMMERTIGLPTKLSLHTPATGAVVQWTDITGPEVEALHAGPSGNTLLVQVHRLRTLTDTFRDPALAVWHVGDPAPRSYDELYLTEQTTKGFVHVDPDAISSGTPFVFDSGVAIAFGCPICSPPPPAGPSGGGSDVVQEWGVVRGSLAQKLVLPGIGRTPGAFGSYWLSDVTFYNPLDAPQHVTVRFVPTGDAPQAADVQEKTLTLAAREIRLVPDALKALFNLDAGGGAFFITPESGVNVTSRTYSQAANGTYGFAMNAIDVYAAAGPRFPLTFSGAFFGANTRTNLVLTDTSGRGAAVSLRASDANGFVAGAPSILSATPANGQQQINGIAAMVGLPSNESGGLIVQPNSGSVIASVIAIDNRTNDPTYFPPDLPATVARTIPVIGHIDGANNSKFRSDLYLFNPTATPSMVSLQINSTTGQSSLSLTLLGFEARVIHDVLMTAFAQTGTARLRYQSFGTNGSAGTVRVTSRTYTLNDDGGTYGFLMPPLNSFQSAAAGDSLEILGTTTDTATRTNIGLVDLTANTTSRQSHASIAFFDKSGVKIDELTVTIPSATVMQLNDIYRARNIPASTGPVLIRVTSVDGLIGAYAAAVDNGTNDSAYLPANLAAK
jgi:hypothetical protein